MKVQKKKSKGVSARGFGPCGKVKNKVKLKLNPPMRILGKVKFEGVPNTKNIIEFKKGSLVGCRLRGSTPEPTVGAVTHGSHGRGWGASMRAPNDQWPRVLG